MSLLGKIGKVASSNMAKEIVKVASSKITSHSTEKNSKDQTDNYCNYIKNNIVRVCKKLSDLKDETQNSINEISSMKTSQLILKKMKGDYNIIREKIDINLQYLYLSRDFFNILSKHQSGISLSDEEKMLIIRFSPYFDDIPVLEGEKDNSILGEFIEIKEELLSEFISSKKDIANFTLKEYSRRYDKQIEENIIPDIDSSIENFKNSISCNEKISDGKSYDKINGSVECPNCHTMLNESSKFCLECGNKIEIKRPLFCFQCGESILEGTKFCSNCGTKI